MVRDRVMVLGSAGQMGQALAHVLGVAEPWEMGWFSHEDLDITDTAALCSAVADFAPDLIVNLAAMTQVEAAQKDDVAAAKANFHAVAALAGLAGARDVPVIHLSTDFVFDGQAEAPYLPDDPMNPLNHYGASKMMGEESLRQTLPWHVIVRTSTILSPWGDNILTRTLALLAGRDEVSMVTDRISGPTPAAALAQALVTIGRAILGGKRDGFGTFHFCGVPQVSRLELTQAIAEAYAPFAETVARILPAQSADFPDQAPRPAFSVLECSKIKRVYGIDQPSWRAAVENDIRTLCSGKT